MYDFLYQEEFWNEVIIVSSITVAVTILVGLIIYNLLMRKVVADIAEIKKSIDFSKIELKNERNDMKCEDSSLNNDHSNLNNDNSDLKNAHRIIEKVDETKTVIFSVKDYMIESKATDLVRYANLTDRLNAISESLSNLNSLMNETKMLVIENHKLEEKYNLSMPKINTKLAE